MPRLLIPAQDHRQVLPMLRIKTSRYSIWQQQAAFPRNEKGTLLLTGFKGEYKILERLATGEKARTELIKDHGLSDRLLRRHTLNLIALGLIERHERKSMMSEHIVHVFSMTNKGRLLWSYLASVYELLGKCQPRS